MKTFQHKTLQVLATLTEKTVWMSTLQGKIYKQFPLQFWNEAQFNNAPIPFPADWDTALAHFKQSEARKRAEREAKMAEEAGRRHKEYLKEIEERRRLMRCLWRMRKSAMDNGKATMYIVLSQEGIDLTDIEIERCADPCWNQNKGYPLMFDSLEDAKVAYNNAIAEARPEYGNETEVALEKLEFDADDILSITSTEELQGYDWYGYSDVISNEFVKHRNYRSIEGAVIVWWQWVTYTGYCRKFVQIEIGEHGKTEQDLITGNNDRVFRVNATVLAYAEDLKGLSEADKISLILGRLDNLGKWEYRKQHPCREDVESIIEMLNIS